MPEHTIYCVSLDIPGEQFRYVSFHSGTSLLDADIVLFLPDLDYEVHHRNSSYLGKPNLSDQSSVENRESLAHWRNELAESFKHGATIFVFLNKPVEVYAATGSQEFSGTGRSMKTIRHVKPINSYSALPVKLESIRIAKGERIRLTERGSLLAAYWKALHPISHYEVYYDHSKSIPLMTTRKGDKTIASLIKDEKGSMLLLPVLDFSRDDFTYFDEKKEQCFWSTEAAKYGNALLGSVVEIHKVLRTESERPPAPAWATSSHFQLGAEKKIAREISLINDNISRLVDDRTELEAKLETETLAKCLLYSKGKTLEAAVIDALRTLGFRADSYRDHESEFDIVFESDEGRFLGEAEGKDSSAISIDKVQQLDRNIQEDFAKEHVTHYAKGVLFGNPHRLTEPSERGTPFTKKAVDAARRSGLVLVHTPDLFRIVQHLRKKRDAEYTQRIRECFAKTSGEVLNFPPIPSRSKRKKGTKPSDSASSK